MEFFFKISFNLKFRTTWPRMSNLGSDRVSFFCGLLQHLCKMRCNKVVQIKTLEDSAPYFIFIIHCAALTLVPTPTRKPGFDFTHTDQALS